MSQLTLSASPAAVSEFLTGAGEFLAPERLLSDLTDAQAMAVPPGSLYSIAQVVAHMHWWQDYRLARMRGQERSRPEHLDDTFAPSAAGTWNALVTEFLAGLEDVRRVLSEQGTRTSPDRAEADISFELMQCPALHSAYHYGQISLLRQIQGLWPPAGGDDSW